MLFKKLKTKKAVSNLPPPEHIAIIMDGNGRWASKRGMPRTAGHAVGAENFRTIATHCRDIGVKYLTVYAFSTENWKRPEAEIKVIWDLLRKYLFESIERMERDRFRLRILGDPGQLPEDIRRLIEQTDEISGRYDGLTMCIAINYGGRAEIASAMDRIIAENCGLPEGFTVTEQMISDHLYSAGIPDPDLLIRPGGEVRLSNFLLWQLAYTEFYFTDTLWPDFSVGELNRALEYYHSRDRRFGGL